MRGALHAHGSELAQYRAGHQICDQVHDGPHVHLNHAIHAHGESEHHDEHRSGQSERLE